MIFEAGVEVEDAFYKFVESLAVHDYHYGTVWNGYEPGSREYLTYQDKIEELKGREYEQEQRDTHNTLEH